MVTHKAVNSLTKILYYKNFYKKNMFLVIYKNYVHKLKS